VCRRRASPSGDRQYTANSYTTLERQGKLQLPCPHVIVLATFKGGSGKSMIAACLAVHWRNSGADPALVDADPQGSIVKWLTDTGSAGPLRLVAAPTAEIGPLVSELAKAHKPVIIDTAGFRTPTTMAALAAAHLALIPVKPSPVDVRVALETQQFVAELNKTKERSNIPIMVRFVLTMTVPGSIIVRDIRSQMTQAGLPLLAAEIRNRVAYCEAALFGSTPTIVQPKGAASQEIARLAEEIENL
jgi:chromosome partitioning protein